MMIKKIVTVALCLSFIIAVMHSPSAYAINVFPSCANDATSAVCSGTTDKLFGPGGFWNRILETFTFIIGAVAVLMIIIGGIRYTTSNGDQAQITGAKNTIIYAVVGLVVAVLSYGIVHFVIANL